MSRNPYKTETPYFVIQRGMQWLNNKPFASSENEKACGLVEFPPDSKLLDAMLFDFYCIPCSVSDLAAKEMACLCGTQIDIDDHVKRDPTNI